MAATVLWYDCGIADDRFEPFIDVPTNVGEGPLSFYSLNRGRKVYH
jgi:hypothetical protein